MRESEARLALALGVVVLDQLSCSVQETLLRLSEAPRRAIAKVTGRSHLDLRRPTGVTLPPPAAVTNRLEAMFEALSELGSQPHVAAAFALACDALLSQLPCCAVGAGLYHIDSDELQFVTTRGPSRELLPDAPVPRRDFLPDGACEQAVIVRGAASRRSWIGGTCDHATALVCPIIHDGQLLGLLVLTDRNGTTALSPHDVELVRYVASQLAGFIHEQRHRSVPAATAPSR